MLTSMNPIVSPITLTDFAALLDEIEEMAALFHSGILAEDLDSDRKEYVTSHIDLLRTLDPGIRGMTYRKAGGKELAILRYENHVTPINITRMSDENVTNTLMDYAWNYVREG